VKFNLIDKIESISDDRIVASKQSAWPRSIWPTISRTFPVLPGVLMLEALTQAAGWLLHSRRNFRLLDGGPAGSPECEIRPVRRAGQCPEDRSGACETDRQRGHLQGRRLGERPRRRCQRGLELAYFNLADKRPELSQIDARLRNIIAGDGHLNATGSEVAIEAAVQRS